MSSVNSPIKDKNPPGSDESRAAENKKTIRKFAIASFLNDLGSDMIYPVWPMFVTSVLGANMTILGLIDGLGEAIVSLSQAFSGYLSDRLRKRKLFIWLGYLMGSFSRIGYAVTVSWQQLFFFRIFDRAGKIRSAPRDAMIADLSVNNNRGHNFGIMRAMDHLGAVFGIIVCIIFFEKLGYQNLFMIAAIPSLLGVALIVVSVKDNRELTHRAYKGISFKCFNKNLILLFLLNSFFTLGFFSYSFLLLYAKNAGLDEKTVIILYLTFTAAASLFSIPFGKLSDIIGRKIVMAISFILWISVCFSFHLFTGSIGIFFVFVLYGIQRGALEPVQRSFISDLAPAESRASIIGAFQMIMGLIALPSSLIAGILWDNISPNAPLILSGILTIISLFLLYFVKENPNE